VEWITSTNASAQEVCYGCYASGSQQDVRGGSEAKVGFFDPSGDSAEVISELTPRESTLEVKKGKPSGRPLGDFSGLDGTSLNTDAMSDAASDYYGKIVHPTIDDIVKMIHAYRTEAKGANPQRRWANLRLWEMDLKGAYTLLLFRPEDVGLFALLQTGDLVCLQLAGIFGWSGTPAAFQVVTRAISWELKHSLESSTLMYVDVIVGVWFVDDVESDLKTAWDICTALLGSGAVADDKTEHWFRLDIIGYTVCLPTLRVLIARKNFLTALHVFIRTDVGNRINLGHEVCKDLSCHASFCTALHRATWGRTDEFPYSIFPQRLLWRYSAGGLCSAL
jgi:hypothetical protein